MNLQDSVGKHIRVIALLCCGFGSTAQGLIRLILHFNHFIKALRQLKAVVCAAIIAVLTAAVCVGGVVIGKKFGTKFAGKAEIAGGIILSFGLGA